MLRVRGVNRTVHLPAPYQFRYDQAGHLKDCATGTVEVDSHGRKYHSDPRFRTATWSGHIELIGLPSDKSLAAGGLGNRARCIRKNEVRDGHEYVHGEKVVSDEFLEFMGSLDEAGMQGDADVSTGELQPLGALAQAFGHRINDAGSRPVVTVRPLCPRRCVHNCAFKSQSIDRADWRRAHGENDYTKRLR
jgi:hypothetical protein